MSVSIYNPMLRPRGQVSLFASGKLEWGKGLVVRTPNWLGDCLVSLPAMYKLRQLVPGCLWSAGNRWPVYGNRSRGSIRWWC